MVKKSSRVSDSMAKKHGTKRKIPIEKITKKESLAVAYTKRTGGLYSKVSQLCLLNGGSQIAILATPPSYESNVSFYSFGHSSVDAIVSAYLSGQRLAPVSSETLKQMREDKAICMAQKALGLGFWWEDEISETHQVLTDAMNSMRKLMTDLRGWGAEEVINTLPDEDLKFWTPQELDLPPSDLKFWAQTLNLQSSDYVNKTADTEVVVLDDDFNYTQALNLQPSDYLNKTADTEVFASDDDLPAAFNNNTQDQDQTLNLRPSDYVNKTADTEIVVSDDDLRAAFNYTQDQDQTLNLQPSDYVNKTADTEVVVSYDDLLAAFNSNTEEQDQFQAICDSFCVTDNNHTSTLPTEKFDEWCNNQQEMDSDMIHSLLFDDVFPDNAQQGLVDGISMMDSSLFSDFNIVQDGAFLGGLDQDDLTFFGGLSELTSVAAL